MLINPYRPFNVRGPLLRPWTVAQPVAPPPSPPPLWAFLSLEQGWAQFLAPHPWASRVGNPLPHPWVNGVGNPLPHPWLG